MTVLRALARRLGLLGRTSRSSFVGFLIWCVLGGIVLGIWNLVEIKRAGAENVLTGAVPPPLPWLPWLQLAVSIVFIWFAVRRFHDQDRPGWLGILPQLISLPFALGVPAPQWLGLPLLLSLIGWLVALFLPGTIGPNRHGPDPRGFKSREHYLEHQRSCRS